MSALYRLPVSRRSGAVAQAFTLAYYASNDHRAKVTYRPVVGDPTTVEVFLIGIGWNVTKTGTQEALIMRDPKAELLLDFVPFTGLVSIDGVAS